MKKYTLLALLVAVALLLTGCAQDSTGKLDRAVVRVGNVSYTYRELLEVEDSLRAYYDQMVQIYAMYGIPMSAYSDEDIRNEALNTLILQAVVLDKADQMKLSELTDSERAEISARTDATMADYREQVSASLTFEEGATDAEKAAAVDAALAEAGITRARVYTAECQNFIIEKTEAWAVAGVTVSDEEFMAEFESQVASEQAEYDADPLAYGRAVYNGSAPLYAPAGYREVEWILLDYVSEDLTLLSGIDNALYAAQNTEAEDEDAVLTLLGEDADVDSLVAQVTVTLNDVTDPTAITVKETVTAFTSEMAPEIAEAVTKLAETRALVAAYEAEMDKAQEAANAALAPEAEDVLSRLAGGEDWAAVSAAFNDDTNQYYGARMVCEGFDFVPEAYVTAAMALAAPGEISDAVYVDGYGCFIIRYVAEVNAGPVDAETVREAMTEELLTAKQDEVFSETLDLWFAAAQQRMLVNESLLAE